MRAEKLRGLMRCGGAAIAAAGVAALAAGCGQQQAPSALDVVAQSPAAGTTVAPTVSPASVPALGPLKFGTFAATLDGAEALTLCETWAGVRAQYVTQIGRDSQYQLEEWISTAPGWAAMFKANSPLKNDPRYVHISTGFGLASVPDTASVSSARQFDQACASAD